MTATSSILWENVEFWLTFSPISFVLKIIVGVTIGILVLKILFSLLSPK